MTLTIDQLNSSVAIPPAEITRAQADAGFLANPWQHTPVYLVDEALMDMLYPPRERRTLDMAKIREIVASYEPPSSPRRDDDRRDGERPEDTSLRDVWRSLDECTTEGSSVLVAWGVYCKALDARSLDAIEQHAGKAIDARPTIFLCGERIQARAGRDGAGTGGAKAKAFGTLLRKVLFHELAHAFIDSVSESYGTAWGRVIEESLCNAIARTRFSKVPELAFIAQVMAEQPIEYAAHVYWRSTRGDVRRTARVWGGWTRRPLSQPHLRHWVDSGWWFPHRFFGPKEDNRPPPVELWQSLALDILQMTISHH